MCTRGIICFAALPLFCAKLNASAPDPINTAFAILGTREKIFPTLS